MLYFKIAEGTNVYNSVVNALKFNGFRPTQRKNYNLYWGEAKKPEFLSRLN
jgi:hypothetical protein